MRHYDFAEVLAYCDITRNKLARWCDAGIIQPGGGGSQGKRREFTFRNLVEVAVCDELHGLGVNEGQMRRIVGDLNTIWNQPDDPMTERPDGPTYRDMTILWLALVRFDEPTEAPRIWSATGPDRTQVAERGALSCEHVAVCPMDATELVRRMTPSAAGGSGFAETGIAIPIARIIAHLERATGDSLDPDAALRKALVAALAKHFGDGTDQDK
jgi:hypothetical protein